MPKVAIDYSKCVIYKIVCNDLEVKDLYVGHTTDFRRRKSSHKTNCNNENNKAFNFKVYDTIRFNGGWNNWSMIEIEKYSCNDSNEATARERHWFEELNANLNMVIPARTRAEYRESNKETINEQKKESYLRNKESILDKCKKYREENNDIIKERKQKYYERNKERILKKCYEKVECECGCVYTLNNKTRHMNSKHHCEYIESKK